MNLADRMGAIAARLPDRTALLFTHQRVPYAELWSRVERAAAAFRHLGCLPGDRVALLLGNEPHFVEALYGALRAGLVAVPINVGFTTEEVSAILSDSGARVVVAGGAFAAALPSGSPELGQVIAGRAPAAGSAERTWEQFIKAGAGAGDPGGGPHAAATTDLALLQYTSGTTGKPKGAMLGHAALLANQDQMARTPLRLSERDVVLCVLPLFHIYALNVALAFPLARGATVLLVERFEPLPTLEAVTEHRASVIVGAPPMYVAWVDTPGFAQFDLTSVRYAVSGAAALPPAVLERFTAASGIPLWEGYGLTETAPVLTSAAMASAAMASAAMASTPRPGSVGRPLPDVELRLVDEHGRRVRDGDLGEVVVRGLNVFSGYWGQPQATAAVLDADGWFRTGDIGYLDAEDLFLVDRRSDLIIVSGFNVYPGEVEEVLHRHPKVAEAAVVGTPHPYTGESVKAVVVLRPGEEETAAEITEFCRRSLARFKCPEVVEVAASLPHLPSGKVRRRDLRET